MFGFAPTTLSPEERALQEEVRAFLREECPDPFEDAGFDLWRRHDPLFSKRLAARGWLGMSIPKAYGGHERTAVERFIVIEEMLRWAAPVNAHWIADRQTAPMILVHGTEEQRRRFLPAIAAGECFFSIGMSEPDAGSDLASVRTAATRVDGGWLLNGTKIWTSQAHRNHFFVVLCRTSPPGEDRHQGLSQLIVDLASDGVDIRPIRLLDGSHHFNEVVMTDVFVPDGMVLGTVGFGWTQVTSELVHERGGPDRFLATWHLFRWYVAELARRGVGTRPVLEEAAGRLAARFVALRQMSLGVARLVDQGASPKVEGTLVKDLGTTFEQEVIDTVRASLETEPRLDGSFGERLLARSILVGPSYTIAGGTTEVLRTVAAKALRGQGREARS